MLARRVGVQEPVIKSRIEKKDIPSAEQGRGIFEFGICRTNIEIRAQYGAEGNTYY